MMAVLGNAVVSAVDQCETFGATSLDDVSLTDATRSMHVLPPRTATESASRACSALFGGVLIASAPGRYFGTLGAALLLTLLAGATLVLCRANDPVHIVVLLAVMALRDRRAGLSETS